MLGLTVKLKWTCIACKLLGYMNKKKLIALFNEIWSAKIRRHGAEVSAEAKWKVQIGWNEDFKKPIPVFHAIY